MKSESKTMINKLGKKLVKCDLNCEGINNNPKLGIIPRCLIQEPRPGKNSCIVVGLNPGKCKDEEKKHYVKNGIKYASVLGYFFKEGLKDVHYYKETRKLITMLGFDGDILWTELIKCECSDKNIDIPIQTFKICINKFLLEEIKLFKCSTIFALGNVAFNYCALIFQNHFIVGLPHPKSYGYFNELKKKVKSNKNRFTNIFKKSKDDDGKYITIHLSKI